MPFQFPPGTPELFEDQETMAQIVITVLGDCGIIHSSIKEWQDCPICTRRIREAVTHTIVMDKSP